MPYLVFETQELAVEAEEKIVQNIREFLTLANSERVSENGLLLGRDYQTQEIVDRGITTRWAIPAEAEEGWYFSKPTAEQVDPIPLNVVLAGVDGVELSTLIPIHNYPELPALD